MRRSKLNRLGSGITLLLALGLLVWVATRPWDPRYDPGNWSIGSTWSALLLAALCVPMAICAGGRDCWDRLARRYLLHLHCFGALLSLIGFLGVMGLPDHPPEPRRLAHTISFMFGLGLAAMAGYAALTLVDGIRAARGQFPESIEPPGLGLLLTPLCLALIICLLLFAPVG